MHHIQVKSMVYSRQRESEREREKESTNSKQQRLGTFIKLGRATSISLSISVDRSIIGIEKIIFAKQGSHTIQMYRYFGHRIDNRNGSLPRSKKKSTK